MNTKLSLDKIVSFEKTYSFSRAIEGEGKYRHIHYGDIHTKLPSVIEDSKILPEITEENDFQVIEKGDILVADASEDYKDLGKAVCYMGDDDKVIAGLHTHLLRCDKTSVNPEYLINLFQTSRYKKFVWRMGTGVSVLGLSKNNLGKYEVYLPTLEEQNQKSSFFNLLNKKIQLQQQKIDLLQEQKKGFLQKMFPKAGETQPEMRFDGFIEDWKSQKLDDFIIDYVEKTTMQNQHPVLTSSQKQGIVLQEEYFSNRQVTTDNNIGYFVLPKGYFTFRSRSDNDIFVFNRNDIIDKGIISYFYPVFTLKDADSDFFLYRINNGIQRQITIAAEGTGQHVLSLKKFKNIVAMFPSFEEQKKIGEFIGALDNKIKVQKRKLELLQQQKQGFMQQMFI